MRFAIPIGSAIASAPARASDGQKKFFTSLLDIECSILDILGMARRFVMIIMIIADFFSALCILN